MSNYVREDILIHRESIFIAENATVASSILQTTSTCKIKFNGDAGMWIPASLQNNHSENGKVIALRHEIIAISDWSKFM